MLSGGHRDGGVASVEWVYRRVGRRLFQYRDTGIFSRHRSVPRRTRYRPKFPRDFEGRVTGASQIAGSRESLHDAPILAKYASRCPHQHSAVHNTRCGTGSKGRRWPRLSPCAGQSPLVPLTASKLQRKWPTCYHCLGESSVPHDPSRCRPYLRGPAA